MTHPTITKEQVDALLKTLAPVREPEFWTKLCQAAYKLGRNAALEEAKQVCVDASTPQSDEIHTDAQWASKVLATQIESLKDNTP